MFLISIYKAISTLKDTFDESSISKELMQWEFFATILSIAFFMRWINDIYAKTQQSHQKETISVETLRIVYRTIVTILTELNTFIMIILMTTTVDHSRRNTQSFLSFVSEDEPLPDKTLIA